MAARKPKALETVELPELTPDDVARYYELKEILTKPLLAEMAALEARLKAEIDPQDAITLPNGYIVKRWEQIGSLKTAEFMAEKPITEHPDLYAAQLDLSTAAELLPREDYPQLWSDVPDVPTIKEALNEAEKSAYFNQSQYLSVKRSAIASE